MTDHLPPPPSYESWVAAAALHLYNAVDTALDELQRDRDFLDPDHFDEVPHPPENIRDHLICSAVIRFKELLDAGMEGS